jgi:NADH:ubiquinone oxidoreductase subunit E
VVLTSLLTINAKNKGVGIVECCGRKGLRSRFKDEDVDLSLINSVLAKYKGIKGSLITILQEVQGIYGYLPLSALDYIAKETKVKSSKVYGVATFYTQFNLNPIGENLIMVCDGTACHVNGSEEIIEAIYEELKIRDGETSEDKLFTLNVVACLGCCSLAPAIMINDETYGNLTPEETKRIVRELRFKSLAREAN